MTNYRIRWTDGNDSIMATAIIILLVFIPILFLVLDIYTTNRVVGNDVEAVGFLVYDS